MFGNDTAAAATAANEDDAYTFNEATATHDDDSVSVRDMFGEQNTTAGAAAATAATHDDDASTDSGDTVGSFGVADTFDRDTRVATDFGDLQEERVALVSDFFLCG
jgi:hypothetical protein